MKKLITILIFGLSQNLSNAQGFGVVSLDINNINACLTTDCRLFFDPGLGMNRYEFPKGSNHNSCSLTTLCFSGLDSNNVLHTTAQKYGQSGFDYWSGPIDNGTDSLTKAQSKLWQKFWKLNASTIDSFKLISNHTIANTNFTILTWPAKGNIYATGYGGNIVTNNLNLNATKNLAPFVDVNGDGIYNALNGDYPLIKGEQCIWWVMNDAGIHTESKGNSFHTEIQAMAYACNVAPLQDVTFYNFKIINQSAMPFHNMRMGVFSDVDLGYAFDDFVGYDSATNMAICYNATNTDAEYGTMLTQTGIKIISSPSGPNNLVGSCMYFNNYTTLNGNPENPIEYSNYLNSKWINGTHLSDTCGGIGAGNNINYIYKDDPSIVGGNSEVQCNNSGFDRRIVIASNDFTYLPNDTKEFTFAVLNTPLGSNNSNFTAIKNLATQVQTSYNSGNSCSFPLGISNTILADNSIQIYPNPATNLINIKSEIGINKLTILSIDGKIIFQENYVMPINSKQINTLNFANGNYIIQLSNDKNVWNKKIVIGN